MEGLQTRFLVKPYSQGHRVIQSLEQKKLTDNMANMWFGGAFLKLGTSWPCPNILASTPGRPVLSQSQDELPRNCSFLVPIIMHTINIYIYIFSFFVRSHRNLQRSWLTDFFSEWSPPWTCNLWPCSQLLKLISGGFPRDFRARNSWRFDLYLLSLVPRSSRALDHMTAEAAKMWTAMDNQIWDSNSLVLTIGF